MNRFASNLLLIVALFLNAFTAGLDWLLHLSYSTRPTELFAAYRYAPSINGGLFLWVMVPSILGILCTMVLLRHLPPVAKGSIGLLIGALNLLSLVCSYLLLIGPDPTQGVPVALQNLAGLRLAGFTILTGLLAAVLYQEIIRQLRAEQEFDAELYHWKPQGEAHGW